MMVTGVNPLNSFGSASTAARALSFMDSPAIASGFDDQKLAGFAGMGEVLVQHAAHAHVQLTVPELSLGLGERRIGIAIDLARPRDVAVQVACANAVRLWSLKTSCK